MSEALTYDSKTVQSRLNLEKFAARKEKEELVENDDFDEDVEDDFDMSEEINELRKHLSRTELLKFGIRTGLHLRKQISEARFDGGTFYIVLILSLIKDFGDFVTGGLAAYVTTWVITPILVIVFLMRKGNYFKRYVKKRFIFAPIIGLIPFINIYPSFTMFTLMMKLRMNKRVRKLKDDIDILDKEIATV